MNEKKIIILIAIVTVVIMGVGVFYLSSSGSSTAQISPSPNTKVATSETNYDWGKINYDGSKATKTFLIKNTGTENLKLFNIKTSCHCTKAHLNIDGVDGPEFGMTGFSSWVGEVQPGKEAKLIIVFDQRYHGQQGIGPVIRYTSVETNDPTNSKITFTTSGTVVK